MARERLSLLLVEDSDDDARRVEVELARGGLNVALTRACDAESMHAALGHTRFDIVLCDYSIVGFSGLAALKIAQEFDRELPFIIISSTLGEETAVEAMRAGANDYIIKANLARLVPAVMLEMRDAGHRRARRRAGVELSQAKTRLQALSNRMLEIQEDERRRIARELHDEIGQALTAVKIHLNTAKRRLPEEAASHLEESIRVTEMALARVRELSLDLRPPQLDDLGLVSALRWQIDRQLCKLGIAVNFKAQPDLPRLAPELETTCFRVAQEAITNILRHASATEVEMGLTSENDTLVLTIVDDGQGFDPAAARQRALQGGSVGILGMEERVTQAGGTLIMESSPGQGARLSARFPLKLSVPRHNLPLEG